MRPTGRIIAGLAIGAVAAFGLRHFLVGSRSTVQTADVAPVDGSAPKPRARPTVRPVSPLVEVLQQLTLTKRPKVSLAEPAIIIEAERRPQAERLILGRINSIRRARGTAALEHDRSLSDCAARYLSLHLRRNATKIMSDELQEACFESGTIAPPSSASLLPYRDGEASLQTALDQIAAADATDAGIAVIEAPDQIVPWVALLLTDQPLSLEPVQRRITSPRTMLMRGTLDDGVTDAEVWMTPPSGMPIKLHTVTNGGHFQSNLPLDHERGRYRIEVMVRGPLGPKVAALFPIQVGTSSEMDSARPDESAPIPSSSAEGERYLLRALNQDRMRANLPALEWNEQLAGAARRHSNEMAKYDYTAHVSPLTNSDHGERLKAIGFPYVASGENIGSATHDLGKIQPGLMGSPSHRSQILNPRFLQVGIGLAIREENKIRQYYATQLFVQPVALIDPSLVARQAFESLNASAQAAGDPAYRWSGSLARIALHEAQSLARLDPADPSRLDMDALVQRLGAAGMQSRGVAYQLFRLLGGQDIQYEYKVPSSQFAEIGAGVVQARSAHTGDRTVWGVILFRQP